MDCLHNPHINWLTGTILEGSSICHQWCLLQASFLSYNSGTLHDLSNVPFEYHHFQQVFSKARLCFCPHTVCTTAPLTSCLVAHLSRGTCILFQSLRERPWRCATTPRLQASFVCLELASMGHHFHQIRHVQHLPPHLWRRK